MNIQKRDYVIVDVGGKNYLMQVTAFSGTSLSGVDASTKHLFTPTHFEVDQDAVLLNLGNKPKPGSVYGVRVNPCTKTLNHKVFGKIHLFGSPEEKYINNSIRALKIVYERFSKRGLDFVFDNPTIWELNEPGKGAAGASIDITKEFMRIKFHPSETLVPVSEYPHVWAHELGHYLFTFLSRELKERWLDLYTTTVLSDNVPKEECKRLYSELQNYTSLKDFRSSLSEEDKEIYKLVVKWLKTNRNLTEKNIALLVECANWDLVKELWPMRGVTKKELSPLVTLYATKSYVELFCESVGLYFTKKELPKRVSKLLEKSLSYIKTSPKDVDDDSE